MLITKSSIVTLLSPWLEAYSAAAASDTDTFAIGFPTADIGPPRLGVKSSDIEVNAVEIISFPATL